MNKQIIQEIETILYGKKYKEVIYENGEHILKRLDEKSKMWITLKFKPNDFDDTQNIELLRLTTKNALLNTIHC